ncbi:MAG: hypothetical protein AAB602_01305 [Patescibacteria group bacterium]
MTRKLISKGIESKTVRDRGSAYEKERKKQQQTSGVVSKNRGKEIPEAVQMKSYVRKGVFLVRAIASLCHSRNASMAMIAVIHCKKTENSYAKKTEY